MMSVLSSDQMGRFPDLNVAEALQRLSGVTISRERGEGKTVQLRGTPANFTNINVNGEQIIGTSEGGRPCRVARPDPFGHPRVDGGAEDPASFERRRRHCRRREHAHFDSPLPQSKRHDRPFVRLQRTAGQGALQYQGKLFAAFSEPTTATPTAVSASRPAPAITGRRTVTTVWRHRPGKR